MGSLSKLINMISLIFSVLAFCLLISTPVESGIASPRSACPPKPPTMKPFDATEYLGNWYQISGLPAFFQPAGTSCVRATYGAKDDGTVSVRNVAVKPDGETFTQICGYAETPNPEEPGALLVHFPFAPSGDYWLLDTDYENYASVYACQDILGLIKFEFAWILVRDPSNVSAEMMNKALDAYKKNNIETETFEPIKQTDCTYVDPSGAEPCTS